MTRVTTLASHYGQIADNVTSNEMEAIKTEIEKAFADNAAIGKRDFIWYPVTKGVKNKEAITDWLNDEGCIVNWNYDQKDGNWVEIAY